VTRRSTYIHNFLVKLLDKTRAHIHADNMTMATVIIEIWLGGKPHYEQTADPLEWVNTYAWAATTDDPTSNDAKTQEKNAEETENDDDFKEDS
jgi:hypothetical protein